MERKIIRLGKTAHGLWFDSKTKVDEDEGSPLQNGVNSLVGFGTPLSRLLNQQEKKIERSAEAFRVRHTRHIFPSKDNFAYNTARVITRSKGREWHKKRR